MFKIDWPCAIGGVVLGYYTKGKVEAIKSNFKGIYTGATANLKESFSDFEAPKATQPTQAPQVGKGNGKNG